MNYGTAVLCSGNFNAAAYTPAQFTRILDEANICHGSLMLITGTGPGWCQLISAALGPFWGHVSVQPKSQVSVERSAHVPPTHYRPSAQRIR